MHHPRKLAPVLAAAVLTLAGALGAGAASAACPVGESWPATFDGTVKPALAVDLNPAPRIVEINLTAAEIDWPIRRGHNTAVYAYNGTVPGPTIEANVGDRLIVNFCNDLPVETTVHWHGVKTPATMDGSDLAQLTVPPGGTFVYDFPLLRAGTFWFHPHVRAHRQVERGLYGALVVRDPAVDEALGLPPVEREHVLILDDIHLDDGNQIIEPFSGDRTEVALEQLNGREGATPLVNGVVRPALGLERRVPHRLRLINAANSRFLRISINEHLMWRIGGDQGLLEKTRRLVPVVELGGTDLGGAGIGATGLSESGLRVTDLGGTDLAGTGLEAAGARGVLKHDETVLPRSGLLLTPGERADVLIFPRPTPDGSPLQLEWHDWQRGRHSVEFGPDGEVVVGHNIPDGDQPKMVFADLRLTGSSTADFYEPPSELVDLEELSPAGAPVLPLTFGHTVPDWETGEVIYFAQGLGMPYPLLTPDDVHTLGVGKTYLWEVKNLTHSHHNFHVHGFVFQHLETELVDLDNPDNNRIIPETFIEDKDTVLIVRRPGLIRGRSWTLTRLLMRVDDAGREGQVYAGGKAPTETTSGGWLAQCQVLEQSGLGMRTFFQVDGRIHVDGFESGDTRLWSATVGATP